MRAAEHCKGYDDGADEPEDTRRHRGMHRKQLAPGFKLATPRTLQALPHNITLTNDAAVAPFATPSTSGDRTQLRAPLSPPDFAPTGALASVGAQLAAHAARIVQQIAPWATPIQGLSPSMLSASVSTVSSTATFRPGHTPTREPDPEPVFQPLRSSRSRLILPCAMMEQPPAADAAP
ncbi:hypothetical protein HYPSUDRAFT_210254 [Hypholoma sublateritium FD-334 SS-4]|uniref:Uncharacterized protein n=1 Tax=Hypholoma sublateritium (strain FD-334 SS-4) TaxID=945553 RepID=A0A0D2KDQ8_HYPSF|nr:hypothetical protein HYPSUDRAFT_210254 [Hypholoma sublateritium FD-334 SS-4]